MLLNLVNNESYSQLTMKLKNPYDRWDESQCEWLKLVNKDTIILLLRKILEVSNLCVLMEDELSRLDLM